MASAGDAQIEQWFPKLTPENYRVTSPKDPVYNCIAWAAGKTDAWWEPVNAPGYYWPSNLPQDGRLETLLRVFEQLGFERYEGEDESSESGYEKVALYAIGDI